MTEEENKIIDLYLSGIPRVEISLQTGTKISRIDYVTAKYCVRRPVHLKKQGQMHNRAKLTDEKVCDLLVDYDKNLLSVKDLSEKYGISQVHVRDILNGVLRNSPAVQAVRSKIKIRDERKK